MSDFLTRLAERSLGEGLRARPAHRPDFTRLLLEQGPLDEARAATPDLALDAARPAPKRPRRAVSAAPVVEPSAVIEPPAAARPAEARNEPPASLRERRAAPAQTVLEPYPTPTEDRRSESPPATKGEGRGQPETSSSPDIHISTNPAERASSSHLRTDSAPRSPPIPMEPIRQLGPAPAPSPISPARAAPPSPPALPERAPSARVGPKPPASPAGSSRSEPPPVRITIGRLDVHAASKPENTAPAARPRVSLADYIQKRNGGGR